MWGATQSKRFCNRIHAISIHAPRVGSDRNVGEFFLNNFPFQSTLPVWGATSLDDVRYSVGQFQSTLPVWGATMIMVCVGGSGLFQSTLPVWGATYPMCRKPAVEYISIHAPRVGSDRNVPANPRHGQHFNPRSPCGERRSKTDKYADTPQDFNPRSPCGERLLRRFYNFRHKSISIHAPRVGSDWRGIARWAGDNHFNPRSPCGERPMGGNAAHAGRHFNPRSPCGERHQCDGIRLDGQRISIHAPRVGSDKRIILDANRHVISIHAPRVGSDWRGIVRWAGDNHFNPRSPCGERP